MFKKLQSFFNKHLKPHPKSMAAGTVGIIFFGLGIALTATGILSGGGLALATVGLVLIFGAAALSHLDPATKPSEKNFFPKPYHSARKNEETYYDDDAGLEMAIKNSLKERLLDPDQNDEETRIENGAASGSTHHNGEDLNPSDHGPNKIGHSNHSRSHQSWMPTSLWDPRAPFKKALMTQRPAAISPDKDKDANQAPKIKTWKSSDTHLATILKKEEEFMSKRRNSDYDSEEEADSNNGPLKTGYLNTTQSL